MIHSVSNHHSCWSPSSNKTLIRVQNNCIIKEVPNNAVWAASAKGLGWGSLTVVDSSTCLSPRRYWPMANFCRHILLELLLVVPAGSTSLATEMSHLWVAVKMPTRFWVFCCSPTVVSHSYWCKSKYWWKSLAWQGTEILNCMQKLTDYSCQIYLIKGFSNLNTIPTQFSEFTLLHIDLG